MTAQPLRRRVRAVLRDFVAAAADTARSGLPAPSTPWGVLMHHVGQIGSTVHNPTLALLEFAGVGSAAASVIRMTVSWSVAAAVHLVGCPLPWAQVIGRVTARWLLTWLQPVENFAKRAKVKGIWLALILGEKVDPEVASAASSATIDEFFSRMKEEVLKELHLQPDERMSEPSASPDGDLGSTRPGQAWAPADREEEVVREPGAMPQPDKTSPPERPDSDLHAPRQPASLAEGHAATHEATAPPERTPASAESVTQSLSRRPIELRTTLGKGHVQRSGVRDGSA